MSEEDKIDWEKLSKRPPAEEKIQTEKHESNRTAVDWSRLTVHDSVEEKQTSAQESLLEHKKDQRIDWSRLTQSPI